MEPNMLSLVLFAFAFLLWFFQRRSKKHTFPPGPKGLPFIGNLHQLDNSALGINLYELSKNHGPLFSLQLGSRKTLIISSAKLAKQVMKTQDIDFCNRPPLISHMKLSYDGLDIVFSPYRDYWRHTKKLSFIHFLSVKRVSMFSSVRKQEVTQMIKRMSERASSSKIMNLHELITCLTSSIVCRTAFGRRYEEEGIERSMFHDILKETMDLAIMFFYTDYFPLLGGILDRITGKMGRLENLYKVLDGFYQGIVDEHLDPERKKLPADEVDVIDALIELKNDPHFSIDLTPIHLKPLIMNLLLAGTDTSASAIVWAMTALMKDPRVMNKVQEEIRNVFGRKGFIEEEDVQKLPYLKAIIKETLRLYPPLPLLLPRETMKKCNFVGYEIPEKTLVYVNAWAVHRDPEAWKNPEEFYPERFLDNTIDFRGLDFELIPFGSGRRLCAGLNMANTTIELVLANLLYSFDWELPKGMKREEIDTEVLQGLIQHKKNPLNLVAKKRMECDVESAC